MSTNAHLTTETLLWDAEQVAASLRVSTSTILNLHRVKQLEGVMVGRHLRWQPDRVRAFAQELTPSNGKD